MKNSGISKLGDFPLQNYSLDSLNEFLKIETNSKNNLETGKSSSHLGNSSDLKQNEIGQSNFSFTKKDRNSER